MLTRDEADVLVTRHLGNSPRASHSRDVARIMRLLAPAMGGDADLWELVGLTHDLDFVAVNGDWSRHGLLVGEWLHDRLPEPALHAIAAHDHRTGIAPATPFDDALKLADTIAVTGLHVGYAALQSAVASNDFLDLRAALGKRPYLADIAEQLVRKYPATRQVIADLRQG